MKGFRWCIAAAAAAVMSLAISGCGSVTSDSTASPAVPVARDATVSFKMKFPAPSGASKSLIDERTSYIELYWEGQYDRDYAYVERGADGFGTLDVSLYPGQTSFYAIAYDAADTILGTASAGGLITSGGNTVVLTFLTGQWDLVNEAGESAPVTLEDGTAISRFYLLDDQGVPTSARSGWSARQEYLIGWDLGSTTGLATSWMSFYSSFLGGIGLDKNSNSISGGMYNLTQKTGFTEAEYSEPGDRLIVIAGTDPYDQYDWNHTQTFDPDITQYMNTSMQNGTTMKGNIAEMVFGSYSAMRQTGITCEPAPYNATVPARAVTAALAAMKKAQTPLGGPLKVTTSYCEPQVIDGDGDGDKTSESYQDINYNGQYDTGEPFTDTDLDNVYDWTYLSSTAGEIWASVLTFRSVTVHPFTAVGSQMPESGVIIQKKR